MDRSHGAKAAITKLNLMNRYSLAMCDLGVGEWRGAGGGGKGGHGQWKDATHTACMLMCGAVVFLGEAHISRS